MANAAPANGTPGERLEFTGSGREYFGIWVVNLVLTIATLGVYSPWAKVRKLRYFWRNTRAGGHPFDFHGRPVAILRGRVIAVLLLAAYTLSFRFSRVAAMIMIVVLCAAGPWLLLKAQQFKLRNSSHRGLRFGFSGTVGQAYRTALPPLIMYFSSAAVTLFAGAEAGQALAALGIVALVTFVLVPLFHRRLKAFQHGHATYGNVAFAFTGRTRSFYAAYAAMLGVGVLAAIIGAGLGAGIATVLGGMRGRNGMMGAMWAFIVSMYLLIFAVVWPFALTRLQRVVWRNTSAPGIAIGTDIRFWPLLAIVARTLLFMVLTLGLYWPFAMVAIARYRVGRMVLLTSLPAESVTAVAAEGTTALGDAVGDAFGFDFGL